MCEFGEKVQGEMVGGGYQCARQSQQLTDSRKASYEHKVLSMST